MLEKVSTFFEDSFFLDYVGVFLFFGCLLASTGWVNGVSDSDGGFFSNASWTFSLFSFKGDELLFVAEGSNARTE